MEHIPDLHTKLVSLCQKSISHVAKLDDHNNHSRHLKRVNVMFTTLAAPTTHVHQMKSMPAVVDIMSGVIGVVDVVDVLVVLVVVVVVVVGIGVAMS